MNTVNPKKLQHSKWTATTPRDREKHFLVTDVQCDDAGIPKTCILEAIHSRREIELSWRDLADSGRWQIGWR
jgi:tryptophan-rich hypothetical protein